MQNYIQMKKEYCNLPAFTRVFFSLILQSLLIHICKATFWEARSPCVLCCGDGEKKPIYCVCVNNLVTWSLGQFQLMFTSTAALHSRRPKDVEGLGRFFCN